MARRAAASALAAAIACLILSHHAAPAVAADADAEFDAVTGYRIARYRTPVPRSVAGATAITAADVEALKTTGKAILIDVMAAEGAGPAPDTGAWRLIRQRENIPGSVWLPDVGKGDASTELDSYFRSNLERLTEGDKGRAIVIYCQADCWMSWNAVKRAAGYGYRNIYWLSEGTDGWRDWGGSFAPATPVPLARP